MRTEDLRLAVDDIALRACSHDDAETLALVGAATFLDAFAGTLPGRSIVKHCMVHHTPEQYAKYLEQPQTRIWIAETAVEQGPVGYSMLTAPDLPIPDPTPSDLELKRIYLLSRFHGSGAGKLLLDAAVEGARQLSAGRLFLGVYGKNARAIAFYRRNGFEVVGKRTFQMGFNLFDDLVLGRELL
jgi:ribosomal protein S18 acetylase RimI-like enzyme